MPRAFGVALAFAAAYLALVLLTALRLMSTDAQLPADQILFIAFSAAGNVGLSIMPISMSGPGHYTLAASMMLGRLLPMVALWWTALRIRDAGVAVG